MNLCIYIYTRKVQVLVGQSCPTLCDPMDCSPPGSSVYGILQERMFGVGSHSLLQGIFLTYGLNPHFLHFRRILDHLSHQRSPICVYLYILKLIIW